MSYFLEDVRRLILISETAGKDSERVVPRSVNLISRLFTNKLLQEDGA